MQSVKQCRNPLHFYLISYNGYRLLWGLELQRNVGGYSPNVHLVSVGGLYTLWGEVLVSVVYVVDVNVCVCVS